jgi:AbrB family looped-hinge helix DNA binding protein
MAAIGESRVTEGMAASIPAAVRRSLGIEPGDQLVWNVQGERVEVRVKRGRRRGFVDFKGFDFGRDTKGAKDHDEVS